MRNFFPAVTLVLGLGLPAIVQAQQKDRALAETLFAEGKRLLEQGKLDVACPKFDDSYRAFPGTGALFNAANCYERAGKTATAWGRYGEAAAAARRDGNSERVKLAEERRAALEPKLARLQVDVAEAVQSTAGLEVKVDQRVIPQTAFGLSVPIDPGHVVVVASAPHRTTFKAELEIKEGASETVSVQTLETATVSATSAEPAAASAGSASPAPEKPGSPSSDGSGQRTLGYVIGGAGVLGLGVGVVFNLLGRSAASDADADCLPDSPSGACNLATADQVSARDTNLENAKSQALISYVGLGVGTAALATGVVLILTASPARAERAARVTPLLAPGQLGLSVSGAL